MNLLVRYPRDLATLNLAGVDAAVRMNEAFFREDIQVHFCHVGEVIDPLKGPVIWVEGLFPLLNSQVLDDVWNALDEWDRVAIYAAGRPEVGILGLKDGREIQPGFEFFPWVKEFSPKKLSRDPFPLFPLRGPRDYYALSQHFFQEKREELLSNGVFLLEPSTVWVETRAHIEKDAWIEPHVRISGMSTIHSGAHILQGSIIHNSDIGAMSVVKPYSVISDSTVGTKATIGPFAHIRPGTQLGPETKVGNFVETKKTTLGQGSKASHLSYLGDAVIGRDCNIGAGTITCNYDGFNKSPTVMGDRVFIGSDSQLVAPVEIGDDGYVAAGSTITQDVPANALGIARGRQINKPEFAEKLRQKARLKKEGR